MMTGHLAPIVLMLAWASYAAPAQAAVFDVSAGGAQTPAAVIDIFGAAPSARVARLANVPARYAKAFAAAAERYNLSSALLLAVARQESGLRAAAVSSAGAIGIMQLMPKTAAALDVDPHDPVQNIMGGAAYLRSLLDRFGGRLDLALAAYNAGPGRIARNPRGPRETQRYVADCLDRLASATRTSPSSSQKDVTP